jgi:hypothetical protein
MRNVQVIDGGANCTYSLFEVADSDFASLFPDDQDIGFIDEVIDRLGADEADLVTLGFSQGVPNDPERRSLPFGARRVAAKIARLEFLGVDFENGRRRGSPRARPRSATRGRCPARGTGTARSSSRKECR